LTLVFKIEMLICTGAPLLADVIVWWQRNHTGALNSDNFSVSLTETSYHGV